MIAATFYKIILILIFRFVIQARFLRDADNLARAFELLVAHELLIGSVTAEFFIVLDVYIVGIEMS